MLSSNLTTSIAIVDEREFFSACGTQLRRALRLTLAEICVLLGLTLSSFPLAFRRLPSLEP
jgi:hypothetical protein